MGLFKLLLLAVVVVGTWYVSRTTAIGARRRAEERRARTAADKPPAVEAEEMVQCRLCGTYLVAARPGACARDDCPYRPRG